MAAKTDQLYAAMKIAEKVAAAAVSADAEQAKEFVQVSQWRLAHGAVVVTAHTRLRVAPTLPGIARAHTLRWLAEPSQRASRLQGRHRAARELARRTQLSSSFGPRAVREQ